MEKTVMEFMKTYKVGIFNLFMSNSFKQTDTVPANELCGYLAIFAIATESGLNLKNKPNRNSFINFYRDLKSKITDMQIIDKLAKVIDWVTTAYKPKAKSEPFFRNESIGCQHQIWYILISMAELMLISSVQGHFKSRYQ